MMNGLCESTLWGMALVFDRQISAGAMPVSSAAPFIPIFRSDVIRSRPSAHRPSSKTHGVQIRLTFSSETQQRQITAGFGRHIHQRRDDGTWIPFHGFHHPE
jgi:hypothetical protein